VLAVRPSSDTTKSDSVVSSSSDQVALAIVTAVQLSEEAVVLLALRSVLL
jgi:hypothetical protein